MAKNKNRDDEFINKRQTYERKYIKDQYDEKYHKKIDKEIDKGKYQSHSKLYKGLKDKGIYKKK